MPTVKIYATEKLRHQETREISDEEWKKYEQLCDANARDSAFANAFEHLLRCDNPDSDGIADFEMEIVEPKKRAARTMPS